MNRLVSVYFLRGDTKLSIYNLTCWLTSTQHAVCKPWYAVESKICFVVCIPRLFPPTQTHYTNLSKQSLSVVFQVQDILGNVFKEKQGTWKWQQKEETDTETNNGLTDNRQSQPCAPLIHRITGGGRMLQCQTIPHRGLTPCTSWLKVQNNDHWPQTGKEIQSGVCSRKEKLRKYLNVKIAMWGYVLTPSSGCFTQNCILSPTPHREKQIT